MSTSKKSGKGMRQCGVCGATGHNSRTCATKKERDVLMGAEEPLRAAAPKRAKSESEGEAPVAASPVIPASFEEHRIQAQFHGQVLSVATREYENGSSTISIRHAGEGAARDLQLTMEGAAHLHKMLTTLLQQHASSQSHRTKPLSRSLSNGTVSNGTVHQPSSPPPASEAQPS